MSAAAPARTERPTSTPWEQAKALFHRVLVEGERADGGRLASLAAIGRALAARRGGSRSLAEKWANPAYPANHPPLWILAVVTDDVHAALLAGLAALRAEHAGGAALRAPSPEVAAHVLLAKAGAAVSELAHALADGALSLEECRRGAAVVRELRVQCDRLAAQLEARLAAAGDGAP